MYGCRRLLAVNIFVFDNCVTVLITYKLKLIIYTFFFSNRIAFICWRIFICFITVGIIYSLYSADWQNSLLSSPCVEFCSVFLHICNNIINNRYIRINGSTYLRTSHSLIPVFITIGTSRNIFSNYIVRQCRDSFNYSLLTRFQFDITIGCCCSLYRCVIRFTKRVASIIYRCFTSRTKQIG